jgi:hypothetical protein
MLLDLLICSWSETASALSIPFCCLKRCALVILLLLFFFFETPAFARSAKREGREVVGESARGKAAMDLSSGVAARLAARLFWPTTSWVLETYRLWNTKIR